MSVQFGAQYLLEQLEKLVVDESRTTKQRLHTQWSKSVEARVQEGVALDGIKVVQQSPSGELWLHIPVNHSRFREGDQLLLNRGNPFEDPQIEVTLSEEQDEHLIVEVNERRANWGNFLTYPADWVLDENSIDLSRYYLEALEEIPRSIVGQNQILPLFLGTRIPQINFGYSDTIEAIASETGLNESQSDALAGAYATDLAYLIQGPPGTGKTHVLAALVNQLVTDGERVLVTSFTHRAINNALRKINRYYPKLLIAKIGAVSRADDLSDGTEYAVENYEKFSDTYFNEVDEGFVVGATPFACRTGRMADVEFDTIIFDEASQITVTLAMMAMLKGTTTARYIFVGDEKQMPPVLLTRDPENITHQSVFAFLAQTCPKTMLNTTYRMNAALTTWPSNNFYDGELKSFIANSDKRIRYPIYPTRYRDILDPHQPKIFVDLHTTETTVQSKAESLIIAHLIVELLASGISPKEIGVVAPFRKQGRSIRTTLRVILPPENHDLLSDIIIDTVERIQGQEREVVLVSLTTSSSAFAHSIKEFFFQPERLNVTITRAKSKLIIIGSSYVISSALATEEYAKLLESMLADCYIISMADTHSRPTNSVRR